jgi:hypothetical protein
MACTRAVLPFHFMLKERFSKEVNTQVAILGNVLHGCKSECAVWMNENFSICDILRTVRNMEICTLNILFRNCIHLFTYFVTTHIPGVARMRLAHVQVASKNITR